jgi:hypothetical protein
LALVNCGLGESAVELLCSSSVEHLDLSWCKVPRHTWTNFFKNISPFKSLALAGNLIIEQAQNDTITKIADFITNNGKLEHLNFTSCDLNNE